MVEVALLSVMNEVEAIKNIRDDPLSIDLVGIYFMQASEKILRDMMHETKEKRKRIRSLEEEAQHYKSDHTNIHGFIICVEEVKTKLHNLANDMYAGMHKF